MTPSVSLSDKYELIEGSAYLTGTQALVRLPQMQRLRDQAQGLNTAGFISGYRGSPLGALDSELWRAAKQLARHGIKFVPGINEELAVTAIWGSQQVSLFPGARHDGVVGMWYGKGPGVDRSADALRHANAAGTSPFGGVVAVAGDDHACKSSTLPHQSEQIFQAVGIPILAPAGVQEFLDYGLHGWAMSRYSGCWIALKVATDTVESSATVDIGLQRVQIKRPANFILPADGLSIRCPDQFLAQEERLLKHKLLAAQAYAKENALDRMVMDSPAARLGILTAGKSYLDVRQALASLGIDEPTAAAIGLRVFKVGMVWPLEPLGILRFAEGLDEILVIEEKRSVLEAQLKEQLYTLSDSKRPRVLGKFGDAGEVAAGPGEWLLPPIVDLSHTTIATVIAQRIAPFYRSERIIALLTEAENRESAKLPAQDLLQRVPYFCSGCPHNRSTKVPEGSRATGGIGCHGMAANIYPANKLFCQMGGEGAAWIGQQPFTETKHVFANLGDGTYFHSGILAIRAAIAAKVPITYKILFNDAVAMTGGQPVDGLLTVPMLSRQLAAEGVQKIVVVSDDPGKFAGEKDLAPGVPVRHRDELDVIQRELRQYPLVSALIYDQTCAAEKRRRRKRGTLPDPARRVVINQAVCEGCGDCSNKSNCLSVVPVETEFGSKRAIDQSSCNKDFSCISGFCPSFVTIEGGQLRRKKPCEPPVDLPEPRLPALDEPYSILITGIGGTGVVTIGALLGMAAHIDGKGVTVLDMTGLAQKGGAVSSHVRIGWDSSQLHAPRIGIGEVNAVIGCDIVVTASEESLSRVRLDKTRAVINSNASVTGEFVRNFADQAASGDLNKHVDLGFPIAKLEQRIDAAIGAGNADYLDASRLATTLMGDAIATNLFMLGYSYQKGMVPIAAESILQAIELNGTAVASNKSSFLWGRNAAHDLDTVKRAAAAMAMDIGQESASQGLDQIVSRRSAYLSAYQNDAYAERYAALIDRVRRIEAALVDGTQLTEAVARNYFKLLAYKDEYEVARLHTDPDFLNRIDASFEGGYRVTFHFAPPLLARTDPVTGEVAKRSFGPWMLYALKALAKLKFLRNTPFDIFAYQADRRMERQLVADYEHLMGRILDDLDQQRLSTAIEIASLPELIRGYGHVKRKHLVHAKQREAELLATWQENRPVS